MNMNKNKIAQYNAQQGDVLLRKLNEFPAGERKLTPKNPQGEIVLAEGETTGHYHSIRDHESQMFDCGGTLVLELKNECTVVHQEHGPITLSPGLWEIGIVNEYDYFEKMKRKVVD